MAPSNPQYRFFYGKMLKQICEKLGVKPSRSNIEAYKALIKKKFDVDSLTDLNEHGMALLIEHTAIFFSSEMGIMLDLPGEDNSEEKDMKAFLQFIYHKDDERTATND